MILLGRLTDARLKMCWMHSSAAGRLKPGDGRHEGCNRPRGRKAQVSGAAVAFCYSEKQRTTPGRRLVSPSSMSARLCVSSRLMGDAASQPLDSWLWPVLGAARGDGIMCGLLPACSAQSPPRPRPRLSLYSSSIHPRYTTITDL